MSFYNYIFVTIAILTLFEEIFPAPKRKPFDLLMILILGTVSAFHGIGGTDLFIYKNAYDSIPAFGKVISDIDSTRELIFNFEPGYLIIISSLKTIGFGFGEYIFIQAVFFYTLLYHGLRRYTSHWGLVMLVFLYKMFFYDTFVSMRQPLTIAGFFMIMKYIYYGNPKKYFAWCGLLCIIHNGAILLLCLYFIRYIKLTKNRLIILSIIFLPTVLLSHMGMGASLGTIMELISSKGSSYSNNEGTLSIAYTLEYYILMLFIIINYNSIIKLKYSEFIIKLFTVMLPFVTLFSGVLILRRELDYFFPLYGIIGGYLCDLNSRIKPIIILLYISISYYGYQRYITNFDKGSLIPYKTWIETKI